MHEHRDLLFDVAARAADYLEVIDDRPVHPGRVVDLDRLDGPLPDGPTDPAGVVALLHEVGGRATVSSAGGRYFGFVTGGALPAALAANWLAGAWDQNAALSVMSPAASRLEEVSLRWVVEALGLPGGTGGALVTGATMANFAALAAARHALSARAWWDVGADGLYGAPPVRVVVGEEVHVSVLKALSMLGLGRRRVERVPVDDQGRMRADALPHLDDQTVLCLQAGNVNTGASDPFEELIAAARQKAAWVHVDGAFGLWAAASPRLAGQVRGVEGAHSWATDGHKWLNVPYDCGIVLVAHPTHLEEAMSLSAAYLGQSAGRQGMNWSPESSRRARGVEVWAALRSLGGTGLAELLERCCRHARRFAEGLSAAGFEVLNQV
ncbi:MAG: aminotransferase class V-fold PLP-dependent enzyme, partial [Actinomycetota bacterium]|nr:aminotransferase class V-fold PLP-dependent enzyme [Actinomycetota bacterium]